MQVPSCIAMTQRQVMIIIDALNPTLGARKVVA